MYRRFSRLSYEGVGGAGPNPQYLVKNEVSWKRATGLKTLGTEMHRRFRQVTPFSAGETAPDVS
jgi:hypothetical protein